MNHFFVSVQNGKRHDELPGKNLACVVMLYDFTKTLIPRRMLRFLR